MQHWKEWTLTWFWEEGFAEFPTCVSENSAHAGSVNLNCILSLDSGFIDNNSALHFPFCDLSTLLQSNPRVTKMLHLLAKEIHTQIRNSVWDSRLTHVPQRFVGTNFLLNMAFLDNHAAKFYALKHPTKTYFHTSLLAEPIWLPYAAPNYMLPLIVKLTLSLTVTK